MRKKKLIDTKPYYVIRYDDGSYNLDDGYEVKKLEATRYFTYKEAEEQAEEAAVGCEAGAASAGVAVGWS